MSQQRKSNRSLSRNSKAPVGSVQCIVCELFFISEHDKLVECDRCEKWVCLACSNLNPSQYDAIDDQLIWYCLSCRKPAIQAVRKDQSIEDRCNIFFEKIRDEFMSKLDKIETQVASLTSSQETLSSKLAACETKANPENHTGTNFIPKNAPPLNDDSIIKELQIREERKRNVIIYNLEEPATNLKEERKQVEEITTLCDDSLLKHTFKDVVRLGKKKEDKPRPLKFTLVSSDDKRIFFRNLKNLKDNVKFGSISVNHDLTNLEREQEKKLYEEAKKLTVDSQGEAKYKVRGPPWDRTIVKMK